MSVSRVGGWSDVVSVSRVGGWSEVMSVSRVGGWVVRSCVRVKGE